MTKILGLDLGTNSIGWALVEKDYDEFTLIDKGVRIFSEGVKIEKGIESSKSAERTSYRSARRIKFRRKLRKYETLKILSLNNMCPLSVHEVKEWRQSNFKNYPLNPEFLKWLRTDEDKSINPYFFRDKASKQKVTLLELGRAFYHITQRRGFLSNRLDQSADGIIEQNAPNIESCIEDIDSIEELNNEIKDYFDGLDILDKKSKDLDEGEKKLKKLYNAIEKIIKSNLNDFKKAKFEITTRLNRKEDLGVVKQKINEISLAMKDGNFDTLGQYFYSLSNKGKIRNQYTAREAHYLDEFEKICKAQQIDKIHKNENLPDRRYKGLAKDLYKVIFFQRPLKSQKGLIGKCSFEKSKTRCAISHPDFEEYRMWTYLNTVKIKTPYDETLRFLNHNEKLKLIPKFLRKKAHFNFEDLAKELVVKGAAFKFYKSSHTKATHYLFNYKAKDSVSTCPISASLKTVFGHDWKTITFSYKTRCSKNKLVKRNVNYKDIWHLLSVSTSDIYLEEYAKEKLSLDVKRAKLFSKIRLKKDFSNLSLNAITKILPYLKQGLPHSHAVFMANIENIIDKHIWNKPSERLKIKNGIAKIINSHTYENELLQIVNELLKDYKTNDCYYSKEAEQSYKEDLNKRFISFFKYYKIEDNKETVFNDLFSLFIAKLKSNDFIAIKRLDEKVLAFLKGENENGEVFCSLENRLKKLYHPSDVDVFKKKIIKDEHGNEKGVLGSPLTSSIKNPMAMRALHQLRKVINTLILESQIDEKTKIHIEMACELNDTNKRKAIQDFQNENKKNRENYRYEIKRLYFKEYKKEIEPTEDDLLRYQLWIEQDRKEIYEEGRSISISGIIGANPEYDIEHTIPRSISQDNSLMNKTLCSQKFNRAVKKNKMPVQLSNHEKIKLRVDRWRKESEKLTSEIEKIVKFTRSIATKEAKDKKIRRRHYLTLKRNYFKGKYERFILEEPKMGFKNSQIPDTGIITKYARAYLKSYFKRVDTVKGGMVAEFRKIWGIQESYTENNKKYYKVKDRSKHTHHTIDAVTIACMTKDKYDVLASAWTLEDDPEKENYKAVKKLLEQSKPWKTFTEDLKNIEDEILVSHHTPNNIKKQSKKIVRIRGKKQYIFEIIKDNNGSAITKKDVDGKVIYKLDVNGKRIPRVQQGDTVRGSLHLDTYYGAIKNPLNQEEIKYVVRKPINKDFTEADVHNIVDDGIKQRINKYGLKNIQTKEGYLILPKEDNKKSMIIKKIRLFQSSVKNPLKIKDHMPVSKSRHVHKQKVYAVNNENYAMAIYEGKDKKGKIKRNFELVNYHDAGHYFKLSRKSTNDNSLVPLMHQKSNLPLKYEIKKGDFVLFFKENKEELNLIENSELTQRLYKVIAFEGDGRIQFRFHKTAMQQSSKNKEELTVVKYMKDHNLRNSQVNFEKSVPWLRLTIGNFNFLLKDKEFKMSSTGKIEFIN